MSLAQIQDNRGSRKWGERGPERGLVIGVRSPEPRKILQRPARFPHLGWVTKPCELCEALQAELGSARTEAMAIHQDHAARVADPKAAPLECAALFGDALTRWVIAASNLECHYVDHGC